VKAIEVMMTPQLGQANPPGGSVKETRRPAILRANRAAGRLQMLISSINIFVELGPLTLPRARDIVKADDGWAAQIFRLRA